ncbi:AraC family transcriptional regulator [Aestuariirhabdus sp. Z084]|uniref:AraC family transcriptional regulator n=1 Tax=Aestuariirhabdus haliotis TaxID=2918751 RepID=UPI00201B36F6|nr:AraC family transcriptional regulator [Aestuariirhabdus haliotis]MCL6416844.1 AraC family transcriptional regulator [Aestuariirhabdus haliotis]MCL6420844.1 AraC family transcriptional regulator [Aestuariirhabdus haliotis]
MVDRLASLFEHFSLRAQHFQSGALCGRNAVELAASSGQLHLIRSGNVEVWHGTKKAYAVEQPSLLFYPRPLPRHFVTDNEAGADFLCANLSFEGEQANPIANALPDSFCSPLASLPHCEQVVSLLFAEASACNCGRQVVLDRLFEVLMVQFLREFMEQGAAKVGMLAGLANEKLRRAIVAIHENPEVDWTVASLAAEAHMSRSAFSNAFRETLGETPARYLQRWRIGLVQKWIKSGQSLKLVAEEAGYKSESALSRAFKAQCGLSPREWLNHVKVTPE